MMRRTIRAARKRNYGGVGVGDVVTRIVVRTGRTKRRGI